MKDFRDHPSLAARRYTVPALSVREITKPVQRSVGTLTVEVRANPLTVSVRNNDGLPVQEVVFENDGSLSFRLDEHPVLGMGGGGPRPAPGTPWREQPVQFDRRGQLDTMQPRWQADMYGSRNPGNGQTQRKRGTENGKDHAILRFSVSLCFTVASVISVTVVSVISVTVAAEG
jgi:hypothetical protein